MKERASDRAASGPLHFISFCSLPRSFFRSLAHFSLLFRSFVHYCHSRLEKNQKRVLSASIARSFLWLVRSFSHNIATRWHRNTYAKRIWLRLNQTETMPAKQAARQAGSCQHTTPTYLTACIPAHLAWLRCLFGWLLRGLSCWM